MNNAEMYVRGPDGQWIAVSGGGSSGGGADGEDGGYYVPSISQPATDRMNIEFSPSKSGMADAPSSMIELPRGANGTSVRVLEVLEDPSDGGTNIVTFSDGNRLLIKNGKTGAKGDTGPAGANGLAGADGAKGDAGPPGKSAYQYAKDGGYTGTESEFAEMLARNPADAVFDPTAYDVSVLHLTGDMAGISNDNAVTLAYTCMDKDGAEHTGSCTLKWQGSSSIQAGQKAGGKMNFTIKFDKNIDVGYGGQTKYCLKANTIDHSHARNIVSARIWGMMVAARNNVHATLAASPNYGAVNGFPVAIMLNGKFHGLYTFNIPKDGWMLNMGAGTNECILCADHSTATQFKGEALCDESDFEIEYITDKNDTAWAVASVNRLINACINSNGSDLDTTIAQYLDWESAIDYYILVALLDGADMTDKNYILATYDGVKWFFSAYDMDSCYGLKWDASGFSKSDYGAGSSFVGYATTHRLMELIKRFKTDTLRARYANLRAGVLSDASIAREFERFGGTIPSRLLEEDRNKWPKLPLTSVNNTFQILGWLSRRLPVVDKWITDLPPQEAGGEAYVNQVPLSIDTDGSVYNGGLGYKNGYRLSSSGNNSEAAASTVTGYIRVTSSDVIRMKGVAFNAQAVNGGTHCYLVTYTDDFAVNSYCHYDTFASGGANAFRLTYDETTGVYTFDISTMGSPTGVAYIRLNGIGSGADMIVTVNEEIE